MLAMSPLSVKANIVNLRGIAQMLGAQYCKLSFSGAFAFGRVSEGKLSLTGASCTISLSNSIIGYQLQSAAACML